MCPTESAWRRHRSASKRHIKAESLNSGNTHDMAKINRSKMIGRGHDQQKPRSSVMDMPTVSRNCEHERQIDMGSATERET
eukprot:c18186_g1_i2 orf=51-293(-)